MSALTAQPFGSDHDPMRDKSYRHTKLGPVVNEFLNWLEIENKADRTLYQYEHDLSRGCLMYPSLGIEDWTTQHLVHVMKAFPKKSRDIRMAPYRTMFNWATYTRRYIEFDIAKGLPKAGRPGKKSYDLFEADERYDMVRLPIIDGALLALMLDAGPRQESCRELQVYKFRATKTRDMPYGGIYFEADKNDKSRVVPCTERLALWLNELIVSESLGPEDYFWYTRPQGRNIRRSQPMGHASFVRWWERVLRDAGVRYRHPHMTRHTFATCFLRGELPGQTERPKNGLQVLRRLLGHARIQTTDEYYSHLDQHDIALDMGLISE